MGELKISAFNIRGFNSSVPYMRKLIETNDILLISEHWLHDNKLNRLEEISDNINYCAKSSRYSSSDYYGLRRGQGGVAIIWHKGLKGISEVKSIVYDRVCAVRLQTECGAVFFIYSVYLPSRGNPEDYASALDDTIEIIDSRENNSYCIIGGDINGDLGSLCGSRSNRMANDRGKLFHEIILRYNLLVCNLDAKASGPVDTFHGPTGSSTIDVICVPNDISHHLISCTVSDNDPDNCSDHEAVSVVLDVNAIITTKQHESIRKFKKWDKLTPEQLMKKYAKPVETLLLQHVEPKLLNKPTADIDQIITDICTILTSCDKNIPTGSYRPNIKPFWNKNLSMLKSIKVDKYSKWVKAGRPRDKSNILYTEYKVSKVNFGKALRKLSRAYENDKMLDAVSAAQLDRNAFWRIVKRSRKSGVGSINAIRKPDKTVVHDVDSVLRAFKVHFESVSTPTADPSFDNEHYEHVNKTVNEYNSLKDLDNFLSNPFTEQEVFKATQKLKLKKACGYDNVSAEHIRHAGPCLVYILTMVFNLIVSSEYIPVNFRRGLQVPLYKGKNTCILDMNNYRGITLLTNFNKAFEILVWSRLESWWNSSGIISILQGACRKGQSCVHTAYTLHETVSSALDNNKCAFVAYFDVSKAFDTVWINGLFYKLYEMGFRGKTWRLLYRSYINFMCKVRIKDKCSNWFEMGCGIHQGGFLSLYKYIAFINQLIVELQDSGYCYMIRDLHSSSPGYADDIAAVCPTKQKMDMALKLVDQYGKRWRFNFNAKKSAIMVYGENEKTNLTNSKNRIFKLGDKRVLERTSYDHVGIKACLYETNNRVEEKICKGRRAFNACSGVGIRKNGLSMKSCNIIFWGIIIPIVTFGSELWVLSDKDYENLCMFQRQTGRRIQRFPARSPSCSSFYGLGWLRITTYILVKKLLFVLTILRLDPENIVRKIFILKVEMYHMNSDVHILNNNKSPTFDILNHAKKAGVYKLIYDMCTGKMQIFPKATWSKIIWAKAWQLDDLYWFSTNSLNSNNDLLNKLDTKARYLSWWELSDNNVSMTGVSEIMSRLICHASRLKSDDPRLKDLSPCHRMCSKCDMFVTEDLFHIIMQCPSNAEKMAETQRRIIDLDSNLKTAFEESPEEVFNWLIGKNIPNIDIDILQKMRIIAGTEICHIYRLLCKERSGVG